MPLYEYRCQACHHRFEVIQKFSDAPLSECPKCGGAVEKLVSSPAFQFKGSGWYVTDYAKKSETKSDAKSDGGSSESKARDAADSKAKETTATDSATSKPSSSGTS